MTRPCDPRERGVSLIVVLLILVIVSILGVGGAQIAMMAERGSRNDRDMQVAWQAAEAALADAEFDIHGQTPEPSTSRTKLVFVDNKANRNLFLPNCVGTGVSQGLCEFVQDTRPAWLSVDFTVDNGTARTTALGTFTGRRFASVAAGGPAAGVQPAKAPRYIIEAIPDEWIERNRGTSAGPKPNLYRVTAMGFGPREDIRAVAQILYRD
jgi:type IV pilus assembly protein PilX